MRLAALGQDCPKTLILERRADYTYDRTWCFWGDVSPSVSRLTEHRWPTIKLRSADRHIEVDCHSMPYRMISGSGFYRAALKAIEQSVRIDLRLGVSQSSEPRKLNGRWHIQTSDAIYGGALLVDTRPIPNPAAENALLWQSFSGHEIECDAEVFDPACADLMDFTAADSTAVHFNYVLPFSPTRALVETTVLSPERIGYGALSGKLHDAIAGRLNGNSFRVLRTESGVLPMGGMPRRAGGDATYVRAGLTAGGARASTGYAFQRIQTWADSCCQSICRLGVPTPHSPDPLLLRGLDRLFVSLLRSHPEIAPSLFLSLFEKTRSERLIRFLSDRGTLFDYAAIAAALPARPFLAEIPKAVLRKSRQPAGNFTLLQRVDHWLGLRNS